MYTLKIKKANYIKIKKKYFIFFNEVDIFLLYGYI